MLGTIGPLGLRPIPNWSSWHEPSGVFGMKSPSAHPGSWLVAAQCSKCMFYIHSNALINKYIHFIWYDVQVILKYIFFLWKTFFTWATLKCHCRKSAGCLRALNDGWIQFISDGFRAVLGSGARSLSRLSVNCISYTFAFYAQAFLKNGFGKEVSFSFPAKKFIIPLNSTQLRRSLGQRSGRDALWARDEGRRVSFQTSSAEDIHKAPHRFLWSHKRFYTIFEVNWWPSGPFQ